MQKEVIDKISELMTAAFGLIAALAWNDAIKSLFSCQEVAGPGGVKTMTCGPLAGAAAYGPWVYAIFVTIIAVVIAIYIGRLAKKAAAADVARLARRSKAAEEAK